MYAFIRGICSEKTPTSVICDANGVGYFISITLQCYNSIGDVGEEILVHTHLSVSENNMSLYGFGSLEEKEMFQYLISINGIGPKLALAILSGLPVDELKQAIAFSDLTKLKSISGIGKKTAERMIVELKDKLGSISVDLRKKEKTTKKVEKFEDSSNNNATQAILALISLGYKKQNAEKTVKKLISDNPFLKVEELIKKSLRSL
jgi:Holliday junction DNA helicase RuvA